MLTPLEIVAIVLLCMIGSAILTLLLALLCFKITETDKWNVNWTCSCGSFTGLTCCILMALSIGLSLGLILGLPENN